MIFNAGQAKIIQDAVNHIKHGNEQVFQYAGKAGTGKTAILHEIIRQIGVPLERVAPMTYIGQAAIVMRTRGLYNAKTIHSWLYEPVLEPVFDEHGNQVRDPIYNTPIYNTTFE